MLPGAIVLVSKGAATGLAAIILIAGAAILIGLGIYLATRYKRCPSDMILVIYGKTKGGEAAKTLHGGGALVIPLIQDYAYMSLTPITINIPLKNALSMQNIRIDVPSTFTVGISTNPRIMNNAAERLLNLNPRAIENMVQEIIFGVGLYLINVNITDITDESDYIASIGMKAASEAINKAKVDVAVQEKSGAIGQAEANREKEIRVAENLAEAEKGKKAADADRRVYVQQQEAKAEIGEAVANKDMEVKVAENMAEAVKGKKTAEADQRIYVQKQESSAVQGENLSKAEIAIAEATLAEAEAQARQRGDVAARLAEAEIQKAQAKSELERLTAKEVVPQEIDKRKIEIAAEAEAEKTRREAKGVADAVLLKYKAEAEGIKKVLESKAAGYKDLVAATDDDAKAAATLLMIEKIEEMVHLQVEAIKNLKIDKVTVWDSGAGDGGSSTANFFAGLIKSLPPLHDVAAMAGLELPEYLGTMAEGEPAPPRPKGRPPKGGGSSGQGGAAAGGGGSKAPSPSKPSSSASPNMKYDSRAPRQSEDAKKPLTPPPIDSAPPRQQASRLQPTKEGAGKRPAWLESEGDQFKKGLRKPGTSKETDNRRFRPPPLNPDV